MREDGDDPVRLTEIGYTMGAGRQRRRKRFWPNATEVDRRGSMRPLPSPRITASVRKN